MDGLDYGLYHAWPRSDSRSQVLPEMIFWTLHFEIPNLPIRQKKYLEPTGNKGVGIVH